MTVTRHCKTSYREDMKIFQSPSIKVSLTVLIIGLLVFPFVANDYLIYIINLSGIAIIGAMGINILTGYTGQVSLGHAAFLAIGAYTSAILSSRVGLSFWITMPLAGGVAALAGLIVAIPSLRLKGFYIVITTMAFQFIVEHVIYRWDGLTLGDKGIGVPPVTIGTFVFDSGERFYFIILFMAILAILYAKNLTRTKTGRAFVAIRDRDISAEVIGVNLTQYKVTSFVISSFYAGVAGSLCAHHAGFIGPEHFTFFVSIEYVAMIIVGGMGTILGAIYGALFMTLLPEGLRVLSDALRGTFPVLVVRFAALQTVVYGLIIVLFLIIEPEGLSGIWRKIKVYWKNWPYTY
ncbi:MAG: branched-chain amino acid ABC transporter permease [Thermodesulfobacteriota bacterium]|nr:branched-chain amino acid ABC transporter permease [Thermodesulfobacteriota bacterium]